MKEKNKGVILQQKGRRMAEDGEDWNGLEMTILKSLANFFKIHERWRTPLTIVGFSLEMMLYSAIVDS